MTPDKKETRCKVIADVAKKILEDDEATVAQKLEAIKWYNQHRNPGNNKYGTRKNLRNQKPKKNFDSLLGVKKDEGIDESFD